MLIFSSNVPSLVAFLLFLATGVAAGSSRDIIVAGREEELHDMNRSLQDILCEDKVHYWIRAVYGDRGDDPGDFNIATTHLGAAGEEEEYVLNLDQNTISTIQIRQGCVEPNSLYRFVVYFPTFLGHAWYGIDLQVNDETIVQLAPRHSTPIVSTYTNYYFSGDIQTCSPNEVRFRLKLRFGQWPQEISYKLEKNDAGAEVVLTHETSLVEGMTTFHPGLAGETLFVDKCIETGGSYDFTIFSSASHGLMNDGTYEISVNGKLVDVATYRRVGTAPELFTRGSPQNLVQQWASERSFFALNPANLLPDFPTPSPAITMFPSAIPVEIIKPQQPFAESFLPDPPPNVGPSLGPLAIAPTPEPTTEPTTTTTAIECEVPELCTVGIGVFSDPGGGDTIGCGDPFSGFSSSCDQEKEGIIVCRSGQTRCIDPRTESLLVGNTDVCGCCGGTCPEPCAGAMCNLSSSIYNGQEDDGAASGVWAVYEQGGSATCLLSRDTVFLQLGENGVSCFAEAPRPTMEPSTVPEEEAVKVFDEPLWFARIQREDDTGLLKMCRKRTNMNRPPQNDDHCGRHPKICYFGFQPCDGVVGGHPTSKCVCDGTQGEQMWQCETASCPVSN